MTTITCICYVYGIVIYILHTRYEYWYGDMATRRRRAFVFEIWCDDGENSIILVSLGKHNELNIIIRVC